MPTRAFGGVSFPTTAIHHTSPSSARRYRSLIPASQAYSAVHMCLSPTWLRCLEIAIVMCCVSFAVALSSNEGSDVHEHDSMRPHCCMPSITTSSKLQSMLSMGAAQSRRRGTTWRLKSASSSTSSCTANVCPTYSTCHLCPGTLPLDQATMRHFYRQAKAADN